MDITKIPDNEISDAEDKILYLAAEEHQTQSIIHQVCPRCGGKLEYIGTQSSYRIFCTNQCGVLQSIRGI